MVANTLVLSRDPRVVGEEKKMYGCIMGTMPIFLFLQMGEKKIWAHYGCLAHISFFVQIGVPKKKYGMKIDRITTV